MPAPPYPPDTRAKGWRFELDMERVVQSDTWDLAAEIPMAQHALLMMWVTAWQQVPCGSMPADPALIRAKLKVPPSLWDAMRDVVLRGWVLADDGRLYHPTITERVLGMLGTKEAERKRKADYRAKMAAAGRQALSQGSTADDRPQPPDGDISPDLSHGTDAGQARDSGGKDATGTGTGTGLSNTTRDSPPPAACAGTHESQGVPRDNAVTPVAAVCIALRRAGIGSVNPASPRLQALVDAGATPEEFLAHAAKAIATGQNPFSYVLGVVEGERKRAASTAQQLHRGPMPAAAPAPMSFRERDDQAAAERMRQFAPGVAARSPIVPGRVPGRVADPHLTIDMET